MKLLNILPLRKDECGASMLEYVLLASLIAVGVLGGVKTVGDGTGVAFTAAGKAIQAAGGGVKLPQNKW